MTEVSKTTRGAARLWLGVWIGAGVGAFLTGLFVMVQSGRHWLNALHPPFPWAPVGWLMCWVALSAIGRRRLIALLATIEASTPKEIRHDDDQA